MGKYLQYIKIPYGSEEASRRIIDWVKESSTRMRITKRLRNNFRLEGKVGIPLVSSYDLTFDLSIYRGQIRAECWIGGILKSSILPRLKPSGDSSRKSAWNIYQSLVGCLIYATKLPSHKKVEDSPESKVMDTPKEQSAIYDSGIATCPDCGLVFPTEGLVRPDGSVVCTKCYKKFKP